MRGDVLVVVIGVLCWHPGRKVCRRDNRPSGGVYVFGRGVGGGSDHPPFLIQCDQALTHVVDK